MVSSAPNPVLGDSLGRYQLIAPIGHGGMGEVFLGRLRGVAGFAKLVVIKRMHSHLSHDKRFVELFVNEGRVVAQLSHPNICQVHELGEQDGDLFLVMEYLNGVSWEELSRNLPRGTALEIPLVASVLAQACEGLHYAHQLRDPAGAPTPVVHRDVSPQNLFVTVDGICKVLDFGVAKVSTGERYSQSGLVKGKLPYMAPEQIRGQAVDARTDVFAMGVLLWEAFTGSRLFSRPSDFLIWKAITEEPIPPLAQLRPDLPPHVESIVARALQRAPAHRYPSILALAQDLRHAVATPLDHAAIAAALRASCGAKLAEANAVVEAGLRALDLPAEERPAKLPEADAADTLHSGMMPSVMLREASYRKVVAPRRRARWPYVAAPLLLAGATAAALAWFRGAPPSAPSEAGLASAAPAADAVPAPPITSVPATEALPEAQLDAAPDGRDAGATPSTPAHPDGGGAGTRSKSDRKTKRTSDRKIPGDTKAPENRPATSPEQPPPDPPVGSPPAAERLGRYSVDSHPYATITIDGVAMGETPLYRVPLPAGSHQVRAVRADGTTKTFSITIAPGKEVSSGQLKW